MWSERPNMESMLHETPGGEGVLLWILNGVFSVYVI